ncbi:hypothetical protein [Sporolactobacillus laevolacticus]|uniref:Uncharacterized protein n=1 Tax=Sporolactobacillus laevolacticus DSM 442 TaxID=1395513 RepID=V6IVR3_9BACL|nr:hypothetical protein [Sporolactobacillus laevolacticus]EST11272.1 hypothetical protein P343_12755 [Sporolactobacillus laevolacticus DSM 442]
MSEDMYVLKHKVTPVQLVRLNDRTMQESPEDYPDSYLITVLSEAIESDIKIPYGFDQVQDWIVALKSGKKIVNPMSPREELEQYYDQYCSDTPAGREVRVIIKETVDIIAKEHPDVADWLGDNDA